MLEYEIGNVVESQMTMTLMVSCSMILCMIVCLVVSEPSVLSSLRLSSLSSTGTRVSVLHACGGGRTELKLKTAHQRLFPSPFKAKLV
jgi:hypothetical protein